MNDRIPFLSRPVGRTFLVFVVPLICLALFFAGCSRAAEDDPADEDNGTPARHATGLNNAPTAGSYCDVDTLVIDRLVDAMTLRQKIAQMYVVGVQVFPGFEFGDARRFIKQLGVGGVFLQPGTGIGLWPAWTVENVNTVQQYALARDLAIPLLVVCDQEGGIPQAVNAITGGTDQPGNLGLGATFNPENTYQSYRLMGRQLHELGINNAYAPVAELMTSHLESSMYTRCFGEHTATVADHVRHAVPGFQESLVIAAAKHFPGHSTAPGDEHSGLTVNDETEQAVREKYFPPFQAAIEAGVDMMMTTHAAFLAWGNATPTTFSRKLTTEVLRGELGYQGLIVTDDMNMGAISLTPWSEHPDVLAVAAGADLVLDAGGDGEPLYGLHPDNIQWAFDLEGQIDAVVRAVQSGRIATDQIDESVWRILTTKMKYCLFSQPFRNARTVAEKIDTPGQQDRAYRLHEKALTLVRNDQGLWPLAEQPAPAVHVVAIGPYQSQMYPDAHWGNLTTTTLLEQIRLILPETTGDLFDVEPSPAAIARIVANAQDAKPNVLVLATYHAYYHAAQQELVNALLALGRPTVLVATALPYDLMAFPQISTYLATYSNRNLAMEMAAEALFGKVWPMGRLPIALPGLYEAGHSALESKERNGSVPE